MEIVVIAVVVWIACGLAAAAIRRNRPDGSNWFATGFMLGPIGVLLAMLPAGPTDETPRPVCVHCGKIVGRGRQRFCNHCGEPFAASA